LNLAACRRNVLSDYLAEDARATRQCGRYLSGPSARPLQDCCLWWWKVVTMATVVVSTKDFHLLLVATNMTTRNAAVSISPLSDPSDHATGSKLHFNTNPTIYSESQKDHCVKIVILEGY